MESFSFETLILKPLLKMLIQVLQWILPLFQQLNQTFFTLDIVQSILALFQYVMYAVFVLGVMIALIDFVTLLFDGGRPSLLSLVKNVGKGLFVTLFMQKLMQLAYMCIYSLSQSIFRLNTTVTQMFEQKQLAQLFHFTESDTLIGIIVIGILITIFMIMFLQLLERNGIFLLHQCMSVFYIIGICRGVDDMFSMWLRQGVALCFIHFVQILFFVVGLAFLNYPDVVFFAIGLLLVAVRLEEMIFSLTLFNDLKPSHLSMMRSGTSAFLRSVN